VLGKAAFALLREDELTVEHDVELPLSARDDLGLRRRGRVDLGRETRGPAVIAVSDRAVVDLDAHEEKLSAAEYETRRHPPILAWCD
jgi:hypothetical protein